MHINIFNEQVINEIKRKLFPRWKSTIFAISIDVIDKVNTKDYTNTSILTVCAVGPEKTLRKQYIIEINAVNITNTRIEIILYKKGKKYKITILNP